MAQEAIRLTGLDELKQNLAALDREVRENIINEAEMAAADIMRIAIEVNAPRESGYLAGHVNVQEVIDRGALYGENRLTLRVGPAPHAFYGYFLEYGWHAMGSAGRKKRISKAGPAHGQAGVEGGTWIPGRPFIRPALDESSDAALEAAANVVKARLETYRG